MDQAKWERVKDLLEAALELAPERRRSFLAQACGGDTALRQEVEALLEHHQRAGSFLEARVGAALQPSPPSPTTTVVFAPGEIISGRFRVVRFIGSGGMGQVYEAKDLDLGERVALKTIRPEIASEPRNLARFKQEIQLARRVTHPNVCRMFDLGCHRPSVEAGRAASMVTFLTMELLEGETLAAHLRRAGRMTTAEALPLVQQMAGALVAAHDVGVVHRDFKPGNVMLVAARAGEKRATTPSSAPRRGGERAVVTDFGLARAVAAAGQASDENTASALTASGHILGTFAYMAPEQVRGSEATPATDLYALGLVMYEMVTGNRPFAGDTPLGGAYQRLMQPPPSPRVHVPDLDPAWEQVILRCLRLDPAARFASAGDLLEGLSQGLGAGGDLNRGSAGVPPAVAGNVRSRKIERERGQDADAKPGETPAPRALADAVGPLASPKSGRPQGVPLQVGWRLSLVILLMAAGLAGLYLYFGQRQAHRLTDPDTVVLADFTNRTGDPVFNDTLKESLSVALRQSPFLNILSDNQVAATLRLMERPADTAITGQVAREVCQRAGSRAYIAGSIATLGSQYVLGLKAVDCASGDMLAEEQTTASGKETVLNALGQEAARLREGLGESLASVQKFDTPLEQATTSSLEALKACTLAITNLRKQGSAAALPYFERAVELDPSFARAYVGVGVTSGNIGQTVRAREYLAKAFALREHTSEREKLDITALYYDSVTGELAKADRTWQEYMQEYPKDALPYGNLSSNRGIEGNYAAAVELVRQALRLDPDAVISYANLGAFLAAQGRLDEARKTYEEALSHKLDDDNLHLGLYSLAFLARDSQAMASQAAWFEGKPEVRHEILSVEADTEAYNGRLARARELTRQAEESAVRAAKPEAAAECALDAALREAAFGNGAEARRETETALRLAPDSRDVEVQAALAYAWSSDVDGARKLETDLKKRFPLDSLVNDYWLPTIDARTELAKNNPPEALDRLHVLSPPMELGLVHNLGIGTFPYSVYTRGEAYLASGQGGAAISEFQKILDHGQIVSNSPAGPLSYLGLARAYALTGDRVKARTKYGDFLALWKDADPDIPILKQAKAEYAKLQ